MLSSTASNEELIQIHHFVALLFLNATMLPPPPIGNIREGSTLITSSKLRQQLLERLRHGSGNFVILQLGDFSFIFLFLENL